MNRKKLLSALAISTTAVLAFAAGQAKNYFASPKKSDVVGIYIESIQRQIDFKDLQRSYPSESAQRVSRDALRADAIVGWYDNGHNYHEQKMGSKAMFGASHILPEMLKGVAIRGSQTSSPQ